jgi:tetratricopeptide (TPR) repeat protein
LSTNFNFSSVAYANLGDHQKAIEDYDQAITLNPNNAISFGNRGLAYTNYISNTTITKRYGIVWVKGNSLIVIIDGFLVLV